MKNLHATKINTSLAPHPRSFGRFVKQLLASILNHQNSDYPPDVIQRLLKVEGRIEIMERKMAQETRRGKRTVKVEKAGKK